ncbi:alcohol dehydrogenase [Penicillium angulare]|uniref:Alcohol dehydrogenase n=1 Tax=Penicillium angulare TaxID=116970 RepID=A0A9W9F733_9EURO|nr:alcohol dehydrogenase [Penicillium angulare]
MSQMSSMWGQPTERFYHYGGLPTAFKLGPNCFQSYYSLSGQSAEKTAPEALRIPVPTLPVPFCVSGIVLPLEHAQPLVELVTRTEPAPVCGCRSNDIEQAPEYYRRYSEQFEHKIAIRFS